MARILSEPMRAKLGQSFIIENVTGAAGSIGVGRVARAQPDGYTLSIGHWSTHVVKDGNLLTGQNPQSSAALAEVVIAAVR